MAVAFDARSEALATPATSLSWSHTCSGSDRVLYATVTHEPGSNDVDTVSATYNGVSMDILFTDTTTNGSRHVRVFRLVAPATGTNTLEFTWGGASRQFTGIAASFTGVDQVDPDDAQVLSDGGAGVTTLTRSVTSAVGDMVMDCIVISTGAITNFQVSEGNTEINQHVAVGTGLNGQGCSYEAGAASVTVGWTWTETISAVQWAWNINASAGGRTTKNTRSAPLGMNIGAGWRL